MNEENVMFQNFSTEPFQNRNFQQDIWEILSYSICLNNYSASKPKA